MANPILSSISTNNPVPELTLTKALKYGWTEAAQIILGQKIESNSPLSTMEHWQIKVLQHIDFKDDEFLSLPQKTQSRIYKTAQNLSNTTFLERLDRLSRNDSESVAAIAQNFLAFFHSVQKKAEELPLLAESTIRDITANSEKIFGEILVMVDLKLPPIDPSLPVIGILEVLQSDGYAEYKYALDQGAVYLTDGKTCKFKVDLLDGIDVELGGYQRTVNSFLAAIDPNSISPYSRVSLRCAIEQSFLKNFKHHIYFQSYQKAYGIPQRFFDPQIALKLLNHSESIYDITDFCQGLHNYHNIFRDFIALALQLQEDEILASLPPEALSNPEFVHSFLTQLLEDKSLTEEEALKHLDRRSGLFPKEIVEGTYVILKLMAQIQAWKALQMKPDSHDFSWTEMWRFFIDGSSEHKGPYYFENEPFYILSSLRGFTEILTSKEPLCLETYLKYVTALTQNPPIMKSLQGLQEKDSYDRMFFDTSPKNTGQHYNPQALKQDSIGIDDLNLRSKISEDARKRCKDSKIISDNDYWLAAATGFNRSSETNISAVTMTNYEIIFQRIFLGHEKLLELATSLGMRLIARIWAARELEVTHQLQDANGRGSIISLVKEIFNDPDFPIYMPIDPNILDQQGPEELLRDVHQGMIRFCELSGRDSKEIIDVEKLVDEAGVRGAEWDVVHQRAQLSDEVIARLVAEDKVRTLTKNESASA